MYDCVPAFSDSFVLGYALLGLFLVFICICKYFGLALRVQDNMHIVSKEYPELARKYEADSMLHMHYECGVEQLTPDAVVCIFANPRFISFKAIAGSASVGSVYKISADKINWIAADISEHHYIDCVGAEFTQTPKRRCVISYNTDYDEEKFISFEIKPFDSMLSHLTDFNDIAMEKNPLMVFLEENYPQCPPELIKSRHESNVVNL